MSELDEVPPEADLTKQNNFDIAVLDLADRADALLRVAQRKEQREKSNFCSLRQIKSQPFDSGLHHIQQIGCPQWLLV